MGQLRLDEILEATGGKILCGHAGEFNGLSIDSRTIKKGELFIALRGANFDGHDFLESALKQGGGALVECARVGIAVNGKTLIHVGDTLRALQDIAHYLRLRTNVPVVGVTGTNGKTTTKELIVSILGQRLKVLKTTGNLNNHIGLPLCLSRMDRDEEAMVLEMGSNAGGDITLLCDIVRPDYAVVTNVGPAHLEGFGSLEMVRKTDLEILEYVKTVCINSDDLFLMEGIKGYKGKIITYGIGDRADVYAREIVLGNRGSDFRLCFAGGGEISAHLEISGRFNILNALAATSIANELGVGLEDIKAGLESFKGVPMRLEIKELYGAMVISDVYNANPASMEEAIKELMRLKKKRTVAVLGDMLELGAYSEAEHRKLVRHLAACGIDVFIAVGQEMQKASSEFGGTCYKADDSSRAQDILCGIWKEEDTILVKGSRGMLMEKVLADPEKLLKKEECHAL